MLNTIPETGFKPAFALYGQHERLPFRLWHDDFEPIEVRYLIVSRNIPDSGWGVATDLKAHYKELFRLGYNEEEEQNDWEDLKASSSSF